MKTEGFREELRAIEQIPDDGDRAAALLIFWIRQHDDLGKAECREKFLSATERRDFTDGSWRGSHCANEQTFDVLWNAAWNAVHQNN